MSRASPGEYSITSRYTNRNSSSRFLLRSHNRPSIFRDIVVAFPSQAAASRLHRTVHRDPCLAAPGRPARIHEIKHDGYRLIARKEDDRVRLFTRRGYDWTDRYPLIRKAVAAIQTASVVIDCEAVCCDAAGVAAFERLHSRALRFRSA
jgi:ATP-dependent DNA ligase